ncbi:hypothetical protein ACJMK2_031564 [Sinanodonta woodiana]|uniref:Uncharacterized protein n=1 Tax=Sinanodonta woodiana TaxID=1069815 RepID=A0ABD3X2M6_SINWO
MTFNNIDLFRSLVGEIDEFIRGENKSLTDVTKTLSYLKILKGLPALHEIFAFLKAFVLELYKVEGSSNNNSSGLNFASSDTNSKLNKTAFKELVSQRFLPEVAIQDHMDHFRQLKAAQKKCIMLEEKHKQVKEKLVKKREQPAKKLSTNRELIELACILYQTILEKEKSIRLEMQQLSAALQQQIIAMTCDKLAESFDLLDNLAWSNHLSMYILEKVRDIDFQYASEQLYKYICQAYMYPNPEEWNIRAGFHAALEDPVLLCSEFCQNKGKCVGLVDEEPDAELENTPEGIYVKATANCNEGTDSSLTFRRNPIKNHQRTRSYWQDFFHTKHWPLAKPTQTVEMTLIRNGNLVILIVI